ncbi:hypothetical protein [Streptomyces thioluteus]|uniref:hypothetical protein n=1 Tax=Streptomyces thioluteus TaxID=66431 RepID=UPI0031EC17ED
MRELFNLTSLTRVGASAIGMDAASARLGGMGSSLRGWVGGKVRWAGGQFSDLPDRAASWMSSKMPRILMSQPEGAPWAQLAGMGMSISGPVVSQAFMDDFYHGHGNAVGRAKRMAGSIFSLDTLEELFSNVIELAKSLYEGAEDVLKLAVRFATDPKGVLSDLKDFAEEMFTGVINQVVESFKGLMSILDNPSGYAQEVWADMIEGLKEALPNLDGLFDFSKGYARGGVVAGYAPGRDSVPSLLSPGESVLRPELTKLLGTDQVDGLNSAARGGNFKKLAELIEEMWQTLIQPSFVSMSQEVKTDLTPTTERFRLVSEESWRSIGRTVQTAWNVDASPAMASWAMRLRGDMTSAEREFLGTHQSVWSQAAQLVDRSKGSSLASFSSLSGGLRGLEGQFRSSAGDIKDTWRSAMSYVDSSTRSTIDGPYNRGAVSMASAMAGLAGAKAPLSPLRFAAGGVVPGFAPGRDVVPAILSPGEGVLRPEVVRALGVDTVHAWNRSARLSGNAFAAGGIVQPLTSWGQSGG